MSKLVKKENGEIIEKEIKSASELNSKSGLYDTHLCGESCANCYANKCRKISDIDKKHIKDYDFIESGAQLINDKGEVEQFNVSKCSNYKMEKEKMPLTKEERKKFRWLKESLRIYFFDTIDVDTSYKLQSDLIKRGGLSDINIQKRLKKN